jgi:hypothetical protein
MRELRIWLAAILVLEGAILMVCWWICQFVREI